MWVFKDENTNEPQIFYAYKYRMYCRHIAKYDDYTSMNKLITAMGYLPAMGLRA